MSRQYHEQSNVEIEEITVDGSDWKAYDFAVEAGLVEADIDDADDIPAGITIWRYEDDHTVEFYATEEEAQAAFDNAVEWFEEEYGRNSAEQQKAFDDADEYFVMQKSLWQNDDWSPVFSTDDKNLADEMAKKLSRDGRRDNGTIDSSSVLHTQIVTKTELRDEYEIKMTDALIAVGEAFGAVEESLFVSEAGAVNVYMPAGYKARAEFLADRLGCMDNRGNASISALIRTLIDEKINDYLNGKLPSA
ncbi:MAG: hypothetical protein ACFE0Q_20720 [Anaerolineae bacterium]